MTDSREVRLPKLKTKEVKTKVPSCTKHGPYQGPYCPQCYEKVMGASNGDEMSETEEA